MIKIAYATEYTFKLPPNHRFPINKYRMIYENLLASGRFTIDNFFVPDAMYADAVRLSHDSNYISMLNKQTLPELAQKRIGFPMNKQLIKREELISAGTIQGALYALENGVSFNVAGGTHHAHAAHGEAFCIYNDIAVAANYLLYHNLVNKILVIDLDVHQGNGTADMFKNDARVFTFSIHAQKAYPLRKSISDLDVPLSGNVNDEEYVELVQKYVTELIEKQKPDFVFYQCGVDVLETDQLGGLQLSMEGCRQRDQIVFKTLYEKGVPVNASAGGGYSKDIEKIVQAHCNTYFVAYDIYKLIC